MLLQEHSCVIGLGSNLGEKARHINQAMEGISRLGKIESLSAMYKTQPWGNEAQDFFLNAVVMIQAKIDPWDLLQQLIQIELKTGKEKKEHWGPRKIDLDILYYGQKIIFEKSLIIPHPFLHLRNFVLIPMQEVAAGFLHPIYRKTTNELLKQCPDKSKVELYHADDHRIFNGSFNSLPN